MYSIFVLRRENGMKRIKTAEKTASDLRMKFILNGNHGCLDNILLPDILLGQSMGNNNMGDNDMLSSDFSGQSMSRTPSRMLSRQSMQSRQKM